MERYRYTYNGIIVRVQHDKKNYIKLSVTVIIQFILYEKIHYYHY